MDFTINSDELRTSLFKVSYALENRDELEAYTHIALRFSSNLLRVNASNRMMVTEAKIAISGGVDNLLLGVPGSLLTKIAKVLPENTMIKAKFDGKNLFFRGRGSYHKIPVMGHDEAVNMFPPRTDYNSNAFKYIDASPIELMRAMKKVMHCIDSSNPTSNRAALHIDNYFFVGLDGSRIAMYPNRIAKTFPEGGLRIPADQVNRLLKAFSTTTIHGGLLPFEEQKLHFFSGNIACGVGLKTGGFPNYWSVLRKNFSHKVTIDKNEFVHALKSVKTVHTKESLEAVTISIDNNHLTVKSSSKIGDIEETIFNVDHLVKYYFKVNCLYLFDAVSAIDGNVIEMYLHFDQEGTRVEVIDIIEGEYRNVIMARL